MATAVQKTGGTFEALRNHNFRVYFIGQLASTSGTWMQITAQGWLVYHMTQSAAWLGIVACAAGLPILLLSPIAGVIVERNVMDGMAALSGAELFKVAELRDYFRDDCVDIALSKTTKLDVVSSTAAVIYPILLPDRTELLISLPATARTQAICMDDEIIAKM